MPEFGSLPLALEFWETLKAGGGTMIPLLAASVLMVAVVLERLILLRRCRVLPSELVRLIEQMDDPDIAKALRTEVAKHDCPLAHVLRAGLGNPRASRAEAVEAMTIAGREQARRLERGLALIDTIAVASPLLGLLGTLLGMMQVFLGIHQQGASSAIAVSPGIAKALITTIVGLIVAIPSLAFYNYFARRVDDLVLAMEKHATLFVAKLYGSENSEKH